MVGYFNYHHIFSRCEEVATCVREQKRGNYEFSGPNPLPFSLLGWRGSGSWAREAFRLEESEALLANANARPLARRRRERQRKKEDAHFDRGLLAYLLVLILCWADSGKNVFVRFP
jgi:hypothetical protein